MFVLEFVGKLIKILHSAATPSQIAGGLMLGMIMGLTPFWSLHNMVIILIIVLINVNIAMALFSLALFSMFAYLIDPLFHSFGYWLLADLKFMNGFYTSMYSNPLIALSRFNNTVVMGSLISSLLLLLPFYFFSKRAVVNYRSSVLPKIEKMKIVKVLKGTKIYNWYAKYAEWRGK